MVENSNTQVTVNLKEGTFSISGTEAFVEKHVQDLKEFIEKGIQYSPCISSSPVNVPVAKIDLPIQGCEAKTAQNTSNKYIDNGIYYIDDATGEVQILRTVPGKGKAAKAKNVALILLYAKDGVVSSSELIKHCTEQACFDQANFSSTFKKKSGCFIRQGSGQNWTIKLTIPGKDKAIALLESMIDVKQG